MKMHILGEESGEEQDQEQFEEQELLEIIGKW